MNTPRTLAALLLTLSIFVSSQVVGEVKPKQPEKLVGGEFLNPSGSPLAYIMIGDKRCSGTLVSPWLVLTAAHCVYGEGAWNTVVWVNGEYRGATQLYTHGNYWDTGTGFGTELSAQYDLGMVLLDSPLMSVTPAAIITNSPNRIGDVFEIAGFGSNEYFDAYSGYAKRGWIQIRGFSFGTFETSIYDLGSASCGGDSGGPAHYVTDRRRSLAGVISYGTTDTYNGLCYSGGGLSGVVDLQTPSSVFFLRFFGGLTYIDGNLQTIEQRAVGYNKEIRSILRERDLKRAVARLKKLSSEIKRTESFSDRKRKSSFSAARKALGAGAKARSVSGLRNEVKKASAQINKVIGFQVN